VLFGVLPTDGDEPEQVVARTIEPNTFGFQGVRSRSGDPAAIAGT
jgi:hypothetical protein